MLSTAKSNNISKSFNSIVLSIIVNVSFKYDVNVGPNVILNKLLSIFNNSHSVFANVVSEYLSSNNKFSS